MKTGPKVVKDQRLTMTISMLSSLQPLFLMYLQPDKLPFPSNQARRKKLKRTRTKSKKAETNKINIMKMVDPYQINLRMLLIISSS